MLPGFKGGELRWTVQCDGTARTASKPPYFHTVVSLTGVSWSHRCGAVWTDPPCECIKTRRTDPLSSLVTEMGTFTQYISSGGAARSPPPPSDSEIIAGSELPRGTARPIELLVALLRLCLSPFFLLSRRYFERAKLSRCDACV